MYVTIDKCIFTSQRYRYNVLVLCMTQVTQTSTFKKHRRGSDSVVHKSTRGGLAYITSRPLLLKSRLDKYSHAWTEFTLTIVF